MYRLQGVVGNGSTWVAHCSLLSSTDTEELGKYSNPEKAAEAVDVMTLHLGVSPDMPNKNVYAGFQSQASFLQSPSSAQNEGRLHASVACADEANGVWSASEFALQVRCIDAVFSPGSRTQLPQQGCQIQGGVIRRLQHHAVRDDHAPEEEWEAPERPNVSHHLFHYSFQTFSRKVASAPHETLMLGHLS